MTESFKGCIQDVFLNGKPVDVLNSLKIMGVRQCFSTIEPGVHFDSYGFAVYGLFVLTYIYCLIFHCLFSSKLNFKSCLILT